MAILVCGVRSEPPVSFLIDALELSGADYVLLNQQELAGSVRLRWSLRQHGVEGSLQVGERILDIREISGVFSRFMSVEMMPIAEEHPEIVGQTRSVIYALNDLFDLLPARIVNTRRAMMSNNSKPYQALLIRKAGFSIPDTLITNTPQAAKSFLETHGDIIYKSISSVRSIVHTVAQEERGRLFKVRLLPTQFQRRIEGINVRVHVVGEALFATRIDSGSTDYRYSDDRMLTPYDLPDGIGEKCIALTQALGLLFSGIDLIIGDKEVFCLEVNTSPAYSFYQSATGQPIAGALAGLLAGC